MHAGAIRQPLDGAVPDAPLRRAGLGGERIEAVDGADLDGLVARRLLAQGRRDPVGVAPRQLDLGLEAVGPGRRGHLGLVIEPLFADLERRGHGEDGVPALHGHDPPRGEALAVADAVDLVDDGLARVARAQEVAVHRVDGPIVRDRLLRRRERLAEDLTAEDVAPPEVLALSAEEVLLDAFEPEEVEELGQDGGHARIVARPSSTRESSRSVTIVG